MHMSMMSLHSPDTAPEQEVLSTPVTAQQRQTLFVQLYRDVFPAVARLVKQKGGSLQDARDVFQDALVIYYEKLAVHDPATSQKAYLFGIARHVWLRRFNQEQAALTLDDHTDDVSDDTEISRKELKSVVQLLGHAGKKCLELLRAFYYDQQNMDVIRSRFGYGSVRSATVQKYKCLEKIRNEVKERKLFYEDFAG